MSYFISFLLEQSMNTSSDLEMQSRNKYKPLFQLLLILMFITLILGTKPGKSALAQTITFTAEELLARPTDTSVMINIIPDSTIEYHYQYGTVSGTYPNQTDNHSATGGEPHNITITGLSSNTRYFYRMQYHIPGDSWVDRPEHSFHTQRDPGATFKFVVTSDTHSSMGGNYFSSSRYSQTLSHIAADEPDFWFDTGDTPCIDFKTTAAQFEQGYLDFRSLITSVSGDIPIFKALGNHEQEMGWNLDDNTDTSQTQPVLANNARRAIFPHPKPDGFYTGNTDTSLTYLDGDHLREEYYAFTWGDAQFFVLDPYFYTMTWPQEDSTYPFGGEEGTATETRGTRWDWTLGIQQYLWLKDTLARSTSPYKFVFIHNVTGGIIPYGRGGTEIAGYFEWGGMNWDGTWGWDTERPAAEGWTVPVHQLLDQYNVTIFFHGHDHFYAQQELDGVVYQEVPMPAASDGNTGFMNEQTGTYASQYPDPEDILFYDGAVKFANSGHIRVTLTPTSGLVEYVDMADGTVTTSYIVYPGEAPEEILGDVNHDGEANSTDALIVLSGDAGIPITQFCPANCGDVNADGLVNSTDALIVLSYDVGMSVPYGLGSPDCPSSVTPCPGCSNP
jgi:phosphodiesterase/alkaline phosphatase D-like protein